MAKFITRSWGELTSAYSVIIELEKRWPITAKVIGDRYLIMTDSQDIAAELRLITEIKGHRVVLEEQTQDTQKVTYMITRVPVDVPDELICEKIERATKAERRTAYDKQLNEKYPTYNVKITATGAIPTEVALGALGTFQTRPFIPDTTRCFRCQGYGHRQTRCRKDPKCSICSQPHPTSTCLKKIENNEEVVKKCANCGGSHSAAALSCPIRKQKAKETKARFLGANRNNNPETQQAIPQKNNNTFPSLPEESTEEEAEPEDSGLTQDNDITILANLMAIIEKVVAAVVPAVLALVGKSNEALDLGSLLKPLTTSILNKQGNPWSNQQQKKKRNNTQKKGTPANKYIEENKQKLKRGSEDPLPNSRRRKIASPPGQSGEDHEPNEVTTDQEDLQHSTMDH